jgi:hypothetical protein
MKNEKYFDFQLFHTLKINLKHLETSDLNLHMQIWISPSEYI